MEKKPKEIPSGKLKCSKEKGHKIKGKESLLNLMSSWIFGTIMLDTLFSLVLVEESKETLGKDFGSKTEERAEERPRTAEKFSWIFEGKTRLFVSTSFYVIYDCMHVFLSCDLVV